MKHLLLLFMISISFSGFSDMAYSSEYATLNGHPNLVTCYTRDRDGFLYSSTGARFKSWWFQADANSQCRTQSIGCEDLGCFPSEPN